MYFNVDTIPLELELPMSFPGPMEPKVGYGEVCRLGAALPGLVGSLTATVGWFWSVKRPSLWPALPWQSASSAQPPPNGAKLFLSECTPLSLAVNGACVKVREAYPTLVGSMLSSWFVPNRIGPTPG